VWRTLQQHGFVVGWVQTCLEFHTLQLLGFASLQLAGALKSAAGPWGFGVHHYVSCRACSLSVCRIEPWIALQCMFLPAIGRAYAHAQGIVPTFLRLLLALSSNCATPIWQLSVCFSRPYCCLYRTCTPRSFWCSVCSQVACFLLLLGSQ
jgi:hypothetical protein